MNITRPTSLGYRFGMLYRLNTFFLNEQLKPLGLRAGQVACLAELLQNDGPMTQEAISAVLAIDPAATARTVNLLMKKGLVSRTVNPANRRQNFVAPTPEARLMAKDFFSALKRVESQYDSDLTEEERKVAVKLMDRMIQCAQRRKHDR